MPTRTCTWPCSRWPRRSSNGSVAVLLLRAVSRRAALACLSLAHRASSARPEGPSVPSESSCARWLDLQQHARAPHPRLLPRPARRPSRFRSAEGVELTVRPLRNPDRLPLPVSALALPVVPELATGCARGLGGHAEVFQGAGRAPGVLGPGHPRSQAQEGRREGQQVPHARGVRRVGPWGEEGDDDDDEAGWRARSLQ